MRPSDLQRRLRLLREDLKVLAAVAEDLHSLAYERGGAGLEPVTTGGGFPTGVENAGDPHARRLWADLDTTVKRAAQDAAFMKADILNYLSRGGPMPPPSRGSLCAEPDFEEQKANRGKRARQGLFTTVCHLPQPDWPGKKRS